MSPAVRALCTGLLLPVAACSTIPAEGTARGEALYANCAPCHGESGQGNKGFSAPAIAGLPAWYVTAQLTKFQDGTRGAHPDDVHGLRMRPMSRNLKTKADVDGVAAYVASLSPAAPAQTLTGDASKGQATFQTCAACHGTDGAGNEATHAPPLKHLDDWYVVAQLTKFKAGQRGYAAADTYGAQMRGMSNVVPDEAAMRDVAAYVHTLATP